VKTWALPLALIVAASATACLGTSPEEEARRALGPEPRLGGGGGEHDEDKGPEHRPGQPCLVCHGGEGGGGDDESTFVVAGTVFLFATDTIGVPDAEVLITDDVGHELTAVTNRTGNFMVERGGHGTAPVLRRDGRVSIPWDLVFPLSIAVRYGAEEKTMRNRAYREGSCAGCHAPRIGADSAGRVFIRDPVP